MEKTCEFCTAYRPVIYCKADAAYLCLSCDAKVHSANALSNRHLRTLLCDSCRNRPVYVWCLDHRMFVCRVCEQNLHGVSSQHQKRVISGYMGCPSAKDFATFCGFELDKLDKSAVEDQLCTSCVSGQPSVANFDISGENCPQMGGCSIGPKVTCSTLVSGQERNFGSNSQQIETPYKGQQQQSTCFILQQILDLKRLQLNEATNASPLIRGQDQAITSSSVINPLKKLDNNLDYLQNSQDLGVDLQQHDCPLLEQKSDLLPSPFSQSEHLPLPTNAANVLLGESFWECKSPVQSSQLWSQNMQDLGICEDILCQDDFDIPDVDITFRNFEELFGVDQDPGRALLDDKDMSCSSIAKDMFIDQSNNGNAGAREDNSIASSAWNSAAFQKALDEGPNHVLDFLGDLYTPQKIRPSYSAMSFSMSRLSAESSGTECLDSGLSSYITGDEDSCHSPNQEGPHSGAKEHAVMKYREKKKTREQEKQTRYAPRKARSDVRKRVKGRFAKTSEGYDSDAVDVTRSY